MKHFMMPLLREPSSNNPLSEISASPNPNPNSHKQSKTHHRKQKWPPREKENSNPGNNSDTLAGKQSPATRIKNPLPPKPPNPLKRKHNNDVVSDIIADGPSYSSSSDSGVKVVVRMRPLTKDEEDGEMIVQKVSNDSLSSNGHTFTFDSVADAEATQHDIFELVGVPLVENCLAGFNSSVFAYGQTGSGKTYTMWGPANTLLEENLTNDQQGLTPRVFERLFARINEEQIKHADKQLKYQCRCSFLEIYNEQITDLLNPSQKNLQIREDVKSGVYVENLTEEYVSSPRDVIHLLLKGLSNRRTGATSMNTESSRSHSVFTCVVESQCKSISDGLRSYKTSRINLVDLAGSERQKLTGAAGERLKEAGNINRSLSQLGNLINILAEISQTGKHRHIPYRDSRLTFLLQESLGGNAKMAMICAISPAKSCKSETFSTLRFAHQAKAIKNKAVVNEVMQDDVNFLREVIRQLKDELLRMKANGNHDDANAAYASSWNARRSLNLLKFSINHPTVMGHVDDDGDEEMEIDEETVDRLRAEVYFQSSGTVSSQRIDKQASEVPDVIMEEGISEIDGTQTPSTDSNLVAQVEEKFLNSSPHKQMKDDSSHTLPDSANISDTEVKNNPSCDTEECMSPALDSAPCDVSPTLQPPMHTISPELISSSRKSLKTSSMLTASEKNIRSSEIDKEDARASLPKSIHRRSQLVFTAFSANNSLKTSENLAASIHHGLEILNSHRQSSAFRRSAFSYSLKATDSRVTLPIQNVDVGIQASPECIEPSEEDGAVSLCSNCKKRPLRGDMEETDNNGAPNLELVPLDRSLSVENPKQQIPKAVEKVLAGAIRREMALEDFCAKQTSEIVQLNRLVQQYKHERECNAIISQLREDKIIRLENLMDGVLPSQDYMEEELVSLRKEHELLKEKYENHPEVLRTKLELMRVQDELERLRNFFDMGERDVLLEEIHDLRGQLLFYTDGSPKTSAHQKSLLQQKQREPASSSLALESAADKLERERCQWAEVESQWICMTEELKTELEESRSQAEQLKQELEAEKRCSEELKEAMRLAMEGHARMLEQYADLEERHMQMLARQRKIQEGIGDVKKAAARAGVKGVESRFINALAAEISALKVEREKEREYWRDENKTLQSQLRDTAEAVQAAGELLIRLKEAEEAIATAEKRALLAEKVSEKCRKQIETLKKKHEAEISTLNQIIAESLLPKDEPSQDPHLNPNAARYDVEEGQNAGDNRWKEEFEAFYNNDVDDEFSSKFTEPSSWYSGYDKCNI